MLNIIVWLSRKTVYCKMEQRHRPICNNPEECKYGEECLAFGKVEKESFLEKLRKILGIG